MNELARTVGRSAGDVWDDEEGRPLMSGFNTGLFKTVYDLKRRMQSLENHLGVDFITGQVEEHKTRENKNIQCQTQSE